MKNRYAYTFDDAGLNTIGAALHVYMTRPHFAEFPDEAKQRARRIYANVSDVRRPSFLIPQPDSCGFNLASVASFSE